MFPYPPLRHACMRAQEQRKRLEHQELMGNGWAGTAEDEEADYEAELQRRKQIR